MLTFQGLILNSALEELSETAFFSVVYNSARKFWHPRTSVMTLNLLSCQCVWKHKSNPTRGRDRFQKKSLQTLFRIISKDWDLSLTDKQVSSKDFILWGYCGVWGLQGRGPILGPVTLSEVLYLSSFHSVRFAFGISNSRLLQWNHYTSSWKL